MKPLSRKLLLAFSALGLAASATSTYVHYRLLTDASFTSFCDVTSTVSCTQAYLSQYGSFWGVPVAPAGLLYFAFVMVMAGVAGRNSSVARENAPGYIFAVSTIALAFVLYLAWASWFVLKIFCILCAITYVAVIAIFVVSGGATAFPMTTLPGRASRDIRTLVSNPFPLVLALAFMAAAVAVMVVFPREIQAEQSAAVQDLPSVSDDERVKVGEWWDMQPQVSVPVPADGAKVVVVKFNDYQCPACKLTHEQYRGVLEKYTATKDVRYVVKHFPLEGECNPHAAGGNHYASCEAAAGVVMARAKGTAGKLEDWIFTNLGPPLLTPAQMKDAVRTVGGIADYDARYPTAIQEVTADATLGQQLKVRSTPTFFINGRMLPNLVQPQYLAVIIDHELKRASK